MKVWGLSYTQVAAALLKTSARFDDNLKFNRSPEKSGKSLSFTIRVNNSKLSGAKHNPITGHRSIGACYHVFYEFVINLFEAGATRVITSGPMILDAQVCDVHNIDEFKEFADKLANTNVGPMYMPYYPTECCDCN